MKKANYRFLRRQQAPVQIRRITDWNAESFSPFLLNKSGYEKGAADAAAFGAYVDDDPVGAVELLTEEGYILLNSIAVEESWQRRGIGTALLEKAKEFAAELDVDRIYADFLNDTAKEERTKAFLRANGFYLSDTAAPVLTLCPAQLLKLDLFRKKKGQGLPANVTPVSRLTPELTKKLERMGGHGVRGNDRLQEGLSLACVDQGELGAFLVVVKRGGELCLSSAYTDEAHIAQFLGMLTFALEGAAGQGAEQLHVAMGDSAFIGVLEKLTAQKPELLRRRAFQRMVWTLEDARIDLETEDRLQAERAAEVTEDGMEILVPKLMRLMEILEAEEIDCDLMLGEVPYVLIDRRIAVQYLPRDEGFQSFTLLFSTWLAQGLEKEELRDRCEVINATATYAAAVPEGGDLLLRLAALETDMPIDEGVFLGYVDVFQEEAFRAGMQSAKEM